MKKIKVLFLCEHNSARSQMAEGLLRNLYHEKYEIFSAGSKPRKVNPLAIKVMAEIGIDISKQISKSIEEFRNKDIDLVVSVCRSSTKLTCSLCSSPIVMGRPEIINTSIPGAKHYLHHGFDDPSEVEGSDEERTLAFRRIRDEIKKWIIGKFADQEATLADIVNQRKVQ
ncbi:MAG: arsenate reductase ArsC [Candidatus Bathyarchaeia archaeon]